MNISIHKTQVTKKMSDKKQAKRSKCKTFIKNIHYTHLMPTRYTLDVVEELKNVVTSDAMDNATKKVAAQKEAKKLLEERFKTGKSRWFFTRLAF
jgi:large subunit ribosomal protein L27e